MKATAWPAWYCHSHRQVLQEIGRDLRCPAGHDVTRINGILRFVTGDHYAHSFGAQWKRYRLTQLDSYSKTSITRERTIRCLGEGLSENLSGKHVLECGCGAGRFTEILLDLGAHVTSIDLSDAVDANQENCPQGARHRIAQADIAALPFVPRQFDVVFCLGVLQHTPNPETTIAQLYPHVAPGGTLVIDQYTHSFSWYTKTAPLIRHAFKRLPPHKAIRWTERLVDTFLPLHKTARHFRLGQMLISRVSPVVCYWNTYAGLSDSLQREWALVDTHNSLTNWHNNLRGRRRIERTLETLGLEKIWCEYGGNGVEARGTRPL
jgi:SAM-dependent methyltransferase